MKDKKNNHKSLKVISTKAWSNGHKIAKYCLRQRAVVSKDIVVFYLFNVM